MIRCRPVMRRPTLRARRSIAFISLALLLTFTPAARSEAAPAISATIRIGGVDTQSIVITEADLHALPRVTLKVTDEKGTPVTYDGVPVAELLQKAGAPIGKLKGPRMKLYVVAGAADGYEAVFALTEFDPAFTDRVIILADRRDGHAIAPPEGPFRLIVPGEGRHARWVREVTALEVEEAK